MKVRTNTLMAKMLAEKGHGKQRQTIVLPDELEKLIITGFRSEQDCVLFKDSEYFGPGELTSDQLKTDYELFLNDIHIDDGYIKSCEDEFEYLACGIEFGKRLYGQLKVTHREKFRIIISYEETSYVDGEVEIYGGCVVKFHMIRPKVDKLYADDNLDSFESECVMILE